MTRRWPILLLTLLPCAAQDVVFRMPAPPVIVAEPALLDWQRQTLVACLVLEAACQGESGMRAVMAVVHNRAGGRRDRFAAVVLRPGQFSALNRLTAGRETSWRMVLRARRDSQWALAEWIVDEACSARWTDPTRGATHYTRSSERPVWARGMRVTARIGDHVFYR